MSELSGKCGECEAAIESGKTLCYPCWVTRLNDFAEKGRQAYEQASAPAFCERASAPAFCERAAALMRERAAQYDKPDGERSMGKAVQAFNAITGRDLSEPEGWLLLQVLKDVRQWQTPGKYHADSAEDCVAYAALKAESLARGQS